MKFSNLLSVFVFLHFFHITFSQQNFTYYQCTDFYGTYTRNSKFQSNLLKVLYTISTDTQIDYGFYNFSAGDTPNQVNAIALCRGDLTKSECSKCRNDAIIKLTRLCPTEKEAVGWYSNCTLWYSTRTIFGKSEEGTRFEIYNTASLEPTPIQFSSALTRLLSYVNKNASLGDSRLKFATGETSFTTPRNGYIYKIFALSQCNPDLTEKLCFSCLSYLTNLHLKCCGNETMSWFASPSCHVRYEPDQFYNLLGTPSILPPIPAPRVSEDIYAPSYAPAGSPRTPQDHSNASGKKSSKSKTIVMIAVISAIASLAFLVLCYASFRMRKMKRISEETKVEIANVESLQYDFSTIKAATDNFSIANKLGHGGFGVVYKGIVPDGREIAVKRLASNNSGQGEAEFKNEIALLAELQHRNLVRLYGFCLEKKERILVYEFVPNASLDHFLFESPERGLDWSKRRQIIVGIAQGLVYLHEHSRLKIIHRDLKPANILLDAEINPKIADFGLAKLFPADETHENASKVAGTYGYMAPEYTRYRQFSVKSDVYSFGILLLEIICGRRNSGFFEEEFAAGLVSLVWKNWREGTILNVVDPKVALSTSLETEVSRHIHIGLLCVQKNAADRPNMSSIIIWLSTDFSLPAPSFPGYISDTFQLPQQASDSDWSTLNSNMSSTMIGNSGSIIPPF